MNAGSVHKVFIGTTVALLLLSVTAAAYLQMPFLLLIPLILAALFLWIQYPALLFYSLLATIPWSFEYQVNSSLATDLPDEPIMIVAAFIAIVLTTYNSGIRSKKYMHPVLILLTVQLAWTIITVCTSTFPVISIKYLLAKSWYLLAFVIFPLFILNKKKVLKNGAVVLTVSMLVFMTVALIKHGQYNWAFEDINRALSPVYRNHVTYSALLVFIVPLLLAFIKTTTQPQQKLLWIILSITIIALFLSYSRGAWLAFILGLVSYTLIKKKLLATAYIAVAVLIISSVIWLQHKNKYLQFAHDYTSTIYHSNFSEHLVATYKMKDVSTAERYYRWIAGIRMGTDKWDVGFGPNTFYHNYKSYTIPAFKTWVSDNREHSTVHNYFLLVLVEQGVPGFVLFLLLVGVLFWYAQLIYHRTNDAFWKRTISTIASILVMICTVNFLSDLVETDKVGSIFYLCIAVLIIADTQTKKIPGENKPT